MNRATQGAEVMNRATQGADGANQNARSPAIARSHALGWVRFLGKAFGHNPQTQEPIQPVLASVELSTLTISALVWHSHEFVDRGVYLEFAPNLNLGGP